MKKSIPILTFFLLFASCNIIKTIKILKKGTVGQKNYREQVSFETRAGLIVVKVTINGKEHNFIYDSGATNCVTKELAKELNLKPIVDQTATDSEGKTGGIQFAMIDEIKLGKISFLNTAAAIIDLNAIPELACLHVDGLIGANLMRKALWQIDYAKQTIVFASHIDSLHVPANAFSFSFSPMISGTPVIEVEVDGIKSTGNIFDTGSTGEITLSASAFKTIRKKDPNFKFLRGIGSSSAGLYGKGNDTNYLAKVDMLKMGTLSLANHTIEFKRKDGNLGSAFFKDYIVTLDWHQKKIWFVPQPKTEQQWETFGFSVSKDNTKLVVSYLIENSPATIAGIKLGDEVVSVNGESYENIAGEVYCDLLMKQSSWKKEIKLQMVIRSGGVEKTIALEKKNLFAN